MDMTKQFEQAYDNFLAGCDVDTTMLGCAEFMFNAGRESVKQAEPVAVDHSGLIKRIDSAIERVTQGRGLMSIPADPRSDVDLVLSECKALLEGKNPPFWATDFHPAQPVQPAGAQGEPDFWSWVHKAYREPESTNFTIHNMEVAYQAGRVAAEAEKAKGGV